ncbi:MAG TPA: YggS family pyridoxal phosphate-dependent enzyme [Candidatus Rubrimentiphilum sp.]|nr:YggS family pyridoxal phosphate-dependent enzyme [Candidatus Rubrimentiphilum sp.]
MTNEIATRYAELRSAIPAHVRIVAVTKSQPALAIEAALAAGVTEIGENYLQEAKAKFVAIAADYAKHFIGHVQSNKAKAIVETFDVVQSVDRIEAGRALAKAAAAAGKRLPVLIQLNISPSERFGVRPEDAPELADALRREPSLLVDGVMAIGPLGASRSETARAFELAASVFGVVGGTTLSLGMSDDWSEALRAGSTMVRLGSAIFGARPAPSRV